MNENEYKSKYHKYKQKYISLKNTHKFNQSGGSEKIILLDGTSSSGKTTISELLKRNGYKHIGEEYAPIAYHKIIASLPNEYITRENEKAKVKYEMHKLMFEESIKHDKVVFDDISQGIIPFFERKNIFVIVVYASLEDLTRNILNRKSTSPRGMFVFDQFAKRYTRTNNAENAIDNVNRKDFIKLLKKIKYLFESEKDLIDFAHRTFQKMDIDDDNDHYITIRNNYEHDYILKTSGKSPEDIYQVLSKSNII